ncbi:MAG: hypothetical protein SA378_11435 [Sedimentibacter sp.]|uniref:hypothetical protein n=1 Tax=Sedimentibacter sp. TaxID=1960295 RepID=UPI002981E9E4|nr:hypothetical protein [Sedimentibacter sp.]MDW5300727.1 hypothetical protein [Sedimentibacter sp.]
MIETELTFTKGKITREFNGDFEVTLIVPKQEQSSIETLNELLSNDKIKEAKICNKKKKRSLDANAYAWKLITEIANVLRSSKEEVYLSMLKHYGQSSVVSVVEHGAELFKRSVKYCEDFGEADLNGKHFKHIKVFTGSSEYDTREMAILIDGIVSECKKLKISTITPAELEMMKGAWKGGGQ